jgi:hypothetical protein
MMADILNLSHKSWIASRAHTRLSRGIQLHDMSQASVTKNNLPQPRNSLCERDPLSQEDRIRSEMSFAKEWERER